MKIGSSFIILVSLFFFVKQTIHAQETNNLIEITTTGSGKTIEEANTNALRSAIEQAFGVYISSKIEILNNNLSSDEITSITSGNIEKYDILSQYEIPDIGYVSIINSFVSLSKLSSFAESKGVIIEIKGGTYAANIKQQLLNETSEINAISQLFSLVHELLQNSFDYKINVSEPLSNSLNSRSWKIPIVVEAYSNANFKEVFNLLTNSLEKISLNNSEVENYKTLGKQVFPIRLKYNEDVKVYYLRKSESLKILKNIESNWFFYLTNFNVINNFEKIYLSNRFSYYYDGYPQYRYQFSSKLSTNENSTSDLTEEINRLSSSKIKQIHFSRNEDFYTDAESFMNLNFQDPEIKMITLDLEDYKSLEELETLDSYQIINSGIVSTFKYGGYVLEETKDKYTIVAPYDMLNSFNDWGTAIHESKTFNLSNYNNWIAPNKTELNSVVKNLFVLGIGNISIDYGYWSIEEKDISSVYFKPLNAEKFLAKDADYINSISVIKKDRNWDDDVNGMRMRLVRYVDKY